MATDYYQLLGIPRSATTEEIKRAYRRRARQLHPDANPEDPTAEERFKEVARAYETLSDPESRRRYDAFGPDGVQGDGFGFDGGINIGDIFETFFGGHAGPFRAAQPRGPAGPPRGANLETSVDLDFEEAVFGASREVTVRAAVTCSTCSGSGARPGTSPRTCRECGGSGQVRRVRQSLLGQMVTAGPCPRCHGLGEVVDDACPDCRGEGRRTERRLHTVDVPAGVDDGSTLRITGGGGAGPRRGPSGDLYVHLRVKPHPRFRREGHDVIDDLHLPVTQAALGAHLSYETLDGTEDLVIPPGTQTGRVFRLRGRGVSRLDGRGRGDLLVRITVDTPTDLGPTGDEMLRLLAEARGEEVAPPDAGLLSRIRSAFR
ncbi:MAG: molecular chaperone DnaJ [Acidimicrobiales bacterium]